MARDASTSKGLLAQQDVAPRGATRPKKKSKAAGGNTRGASARTGKSTPSLKAPRGEVVRGVLAVLVLAFAVASVLAVASFKAGEVGSNLIGSTGHALAQSLFDAVGLCAWVVPLPLFSLVGSLAVRDGQDRHWPRLMALVVLAVSVSALAQVLIGTHPGQPYPPGGALGISLGGTLQAHLSFWGATLAICAIAASAVVVASEGWLVRAGVVVGRKLREYGLIGGTWAWDRTREAAVAFQEERAQRARERAEEEEYLASVLDEEDGEDESDEEEEESGDEDEADDEAPIEAVAAAKATANATAKAEKADKTKGKGDKAEEKADKAERSRISEVAAAVAEASATADEAEAMVEAAQKLPRSSRPVVPELREDADEADLGEDDEAHTAPVSDRLGGSRMPESDPAWALSPADTAAKKARKKASEKTQLEPSLMGEGPSDLPRIHARAEDKGEENVPFDDGEVEVLVTAKAGETFDTRMSLPPQAALEPASKPAPKAVAAPVKAAVVEAKAEPKPELLANAEQAGLVPVVHERPQTELLDETHLHGFQMAAGQTGFELPSIELLNPVGEKKGETLNQDVLYATAEKLRSKLRDFKIEGEVKNIRPGPVVTMYEFVPAPGVKVSRIRDLSDDLAMAMEAMRVRIIAPIPGKNAVGIEVPNEDRELFGLKELVLSEKFATARSKLTMVLGKDTEGLPYVFDLATAPHLLIAGTTGSGKSVGVNTMIMSLLLRTTPDEVRLIMIDPKMLEFALYEDIPHLLLPVVTDVEKAKNALQWAVDEMERRYSLLSRAGVRNIASFNAWVDAGNMLPPEPSAKPDARFVVDVSEGQELSGPAPSSKPTKPSKLPYIVVVVDEFADLMMQVGAEVEVSIGRIAQKARAAGIHLLLATQRPSTDIVTGVIKANFPSRLSFSLRQRQDSVTILGANGAESLLGKGDMLFQGNADPNMRRLHGPFVSDDEITRVVSHLKAQAKPVFDLSILESRKEESEESGGGQGRVDERYDEALRVVATMKEVSVSLLQRKMGIGYGRSANIIEMMEREGVVAPANGSKPRRVLIADLGQMDTSAQAM